MCKEFDLTNVNAEYAKCMLVHWKCFVMFKKKIYICGTFFL